MKMTIFLVMAPFSMVEMHFGYPFAVAVGMGYTQKVLRHIPIIYEDNFNELFVRAQHTQKINIMN
jgi:hypothetical protein